MHFRLEEVVPWGRTCGEYEAMFALQPTDLARTILGCGDGPASFNAEWSRRGGKVTSFDPVYAFAGDQIAARFDAVADHLIEQVRSQPDAWRWTYHRDADHLEACRREAIAVFLQDYEAGVASGRYLPAALPELPFEDGQFDLALCSHLLFLYSELLSAEFHEQSLHELCRVAREVRIFPLRNLEQRPSEHLEAAKSWLDSQGKTWQIQRVDYELQIGGNEMLVINS